MKIKNKILLVLILVGLILIGGCVKKEIPPEKYCERGDDCVPNKCCHPTDLINKKFAPTCEEDIFCSIAIEDSTKMDVKNWTPLCKNNLCVVKYD